MKKRLPGTVWQAIQPLLDRYRHLIQPVETTEFALYLKDVDKRSDFYFRIKPIENGSKFELEHKPSNMSYNGLNRQVESEPKKIADWLTHWLQALDYYDKTPTIYDDLILKSYEEEFAASFKLVDDDADSAPFQWEQQKFLNGFFTSARHILEDRKATAKSQQQEGFEELIVECESLQEDFAQLTKNQTVSRLALFFAKVRKKSISLVSDLLKGFASGYTSLLQSGVNVSVNILDVIKNDTTETAKPDQD